MKNLLIVLSVICFCALTSSFEKTISYRTITGSVIDADTKEPIIFANVMVRSPLIATQTDLEGKFRLSVPDTCTLLEVSITGYQKSIVNIAQNDSVVVELQGGILLESAIVTEFSIPLIEQDNTTSGGIVTAEEIRNMPNKNINAIAATTAGGKNKRSRSEATNYVVDGIRVTGNNSPYVTHGHDPNQKNQANNGMNDYHTENYGLIVENKFHSPADAPLSTFSIDVDAASYANMRRFLTSGQKPPADAIRVEELINYFDYDYAPPTGDAPISIFSEVGSCPWTQKHKLVHIGIQAKNIPTNDLPASNLVFLVDVSGSMEHPNKLPLVISSFKILVEHLRQIDRVAIVVYAGSSGLVLPSTPGHDKATIIESLERLQAGGSTAGAAGIQQAYQVARENFIKGGNNRVILATDGDFNVGVSSDSELVKLIEKERESGVFLTVLGYGTGNYQDEKMQQLADHGNGNHGYVDNLLEAKKVFVNEFGGTLFTVAKDVKIQVEFNPELVAAYRLIGYENRLLAAEDFNDDKKDAGEIGNNHSVTALYEIIPVGVESNFLKSVDKLKYQKSKVVEKPKYGDELVTVKFRYKEPDGDVSKLIERVVVDKGTEFASTSENFRWSAAVASFGMLMRDSEYAGKSTIEDVESWAVSAMGKDHHGYRKEFLELIRTSTTLEASARR